jgi:hypothetical protein
MLQEEVGVADVWRDGLVWTFSVPRRPLFIILLGQVQSTEAGEILRKKVFHLSYKHQDGEWSDRVWLGGPVLKLDR